MMHSLASSLSVSLDGRFRLDFKLFKLLMDPLSFITQNQAQQIDLQLMDLQDGGFSLDQLMELAGLSVAQAFYKCYAKEKYPKVLICCGPGNNGGDGLVAGRHLVHFGYTVTVYYPKQSNKPIYQLLQRQCVQMGSTFVSSMKEILETCGTFDVLIDAIFGFGFTGEIRPPFHEILQFMRETSIPKASIDIPSGWDVNHGNIHDSFTPNLLVSLTYPKKCAIGYSGIHYLGGRFIPPTIAHKFKLLIPTYPDTDQCVCINYN